MAIHGDPDFRRYQVFVSSTYLDLKDERQAVTAALLESDAFPAGLELFPATDDDAWTLIQRVIEESDYYLLVIGGRYGSIDPIADIGFTEKEYDYAVSIDKPVMAFLHGDPKSLTVERSETKEELQLRLADFREKVELSKHVKYWTSAENLAGQVALSFNKITRYRPAVGWVRGDRPASSDLLVELGVAQKKISELEAELAKIETSAPPGSEGLAQGADLVSIPVLARASFRVGGRLVEGTKWTSVAMSWDDLLGGFAPPMLIEGEEQTIKASFEEWLAAREWGSIVNAAYEEARVSNPNLPETRETEPEARTAEIALDDFGTVMLQFKALGLITISDRRRSVSDTGTYWRLTPLGEARAVNSRAIKRSGDSFTNLSIDRDATSDAAIRVDVEPPG
jgi:hypothetical protein